MAIDHTTELFTIREAATYLKVSPVTIKRYLKSGRLSAAHLSPRTVRIRRRDVEQLLVPDASREAAPNREEQPFEITPLTQEELIRRKAVVEQILARRLKRVITPTTASELVRRAREEVAWYGSDR